MRVQGYGADASGQVTSAVGDLQVGNASAAPRATTKITMKANLSTEAPIVAVPWDPKQAAATSSFSTSATVYDSLGKDTQVQVYFRRTGASTWEYHALVDGAVQGGAAGTPTEITTGTNTLTFDTNGQLQAVATGACNLTPVGASAQSLTFDLGDPTGTGGTGLAGITQFAAASATTFVGQDGYGSGQLTSVQFDKQGIIQGVFTNGQTRALGKVGVARVAAPELLERSGGNLYAVTRASGEAVMGAAGDGGRAFISAGTLEQSNVDIAEQFVRMISAQRAFEANSKTITTADQLLSELISMKR
jgi:flagellar hook protein FlgE